MTIYFFCIDCDDWTAAYPVTYEEEPPSCGKCGTGYQCDLCGYEIDAAGDCQRAVNGAGLCPEGDEG